MDKETLKRLMEQEAQAVRLTTLQFVSLLVMPLLVMSILAGVIIFRDLIKLSELQLSNNAYIVAERTGAVVTELQKERGMSVGHIASEGRQFAPELAAQRALTDAVLEDAFAAGAEDLLADLPEDLRAETAPRIDEIRAALDALGAVRAEIDALDRPVRDVLGYYSPIVADLLSFGDIQATTASTTALTYTSLGYEALARSIEFAGQERAAGAQGFARGGFNEVVATRFRDLRTRQLALQERFHDYVSPDLSAMLDAVNTGPIGLQVEWMRAIGSASVDSGDIQSITGPEWFATSTEYIEALNAILSAVSAKIDAQTARVAQDARHEIYIVGGASIGVIILSALFSWWQIHRIVMPLRKLTRGLQRLSRGQTDV